MKSLPILLLLGALSANAQLDITLKAAKKVYMANEEVGVMVRIDNKSGRDILMAGARPDVPWLTLELRDQNGEPISQGRPVTTKPFIFKKGTSVERGFILNQYFPFTDYGARSLTVSAYSSIDKTYYSAPRLIFTVTEGREVWSQMIAVPMNLPDGGAKRKYSLLMLQLPGINELYVRVSDTQYGAVLSTFSLGDCMSYGKPQSMVDERSLLQILFMAKPGYWRHIVVGCDGTVLHQEIYENSGDYHPTLLTASNGKTVVRGGTPYRGKEGPGEIGGEKIYRTSDTPVTLPQ